MKRMKIDDSDVVPIATQLVMNVIEIDHKPVVEFSMFSDFELPGEGIYLSPKNAKKVYLWLKKYLISEV